jgi:ubiquitin-conjugating enzyme E2 variant
MYVEILALEQSKTHVRQSAHENRIYSVNIHCGADYPDKPPILQFVSKINVPCVDQKTGKVRLKNVSRYFCSQSQVDPTKLPCLANWRREYTMETVLIELRRQVLL